eukprot:3160671-Rhodomonas_salina.1
MLGEVERHRHAELQQVVRVVVYPDHPLQLRVLVDLAPARGHVRGEHLFSPARRQFTRTPSASQNAQQSCTRAQTEKQGENASEHGACEHVYGITGAGLDRVLENELQDQQHRHPDHQRDPVVVVVQLIPLPERRQIRLQHPPEMRLHLSVLVARLRLHLETTTPILPDVNAASPTRQQTAELTCSGFKPPLSALANATK